MKTIKKGTSNQQIEVEKLSIAALKSIFVKETGGTKGFSHFKGYHKKFYISKNEHETMNFIYALYGDGKYYFYAKTSK